MAITPDPLFGIQAQALSLFSQRAQVLASNIANADTPRYLARDLDFHAVMARETGSDAPLNLAATQSGHIAAGNAGGDASMALRYRVPSQPAMDGNTVDTQIEQAAYAENSVRYQASLTFINGQVRMLRMAITGAA
ncbi:MAG: flagellar basal body rod protein FlgB [Gammaproteobacteria bacterium HGW-Gammaproteobacteria-4]|jgi:flagellar basal-body rod protein FlgB|nr:MAG: flagellar basal body rod protein FlgB [Gammaproteobacteria bacterium HGW-Gammaproteobacteria-4]